MVASIIPNFFFNLLLFWIIRNIFNISYSIIASGGLVSRTVVQDLKTRPTEEEMDPSYAIAFAPAAVYKETNKIMLKNE